MASKYDKWKTWIHMEFTRQRMPRFLEILCPGTGNIASGIDNDAGLLLAWLVDEEQAGFLAARARGKGLHQPEAEERADEGHELLPVLCQNWVPIGANGTAPLFFFQHLRTWLHHALAACLQKTGGPLAAPSRRRTGCLPTSRGATPETPWSSR